MTLTFESANEILCDHSNESSLPVLTHGAVCFSKFHKMKFGPDLLLTKFGSDRVNRPVKILLNRTVFHVSRKYTSTVPLLVREHIVKSHNLH